jgi:hypothetical protein
MMPAATGMLDPARLAYAASIINVATFNPSTDEIDFGDFSAFRRSGGKLIMYHGWADADVTPQITVDFYEALAKKSGGMTAVQDFARLFMVPSMDHCGINKRARRPDRRSEFYLH